MPCNKTSLSVKFYPFEKMDYDPPFRSRRPLYSVMWAYAALKKETPVARWRYKNTKDAIIQFYPDVAKVEDAAR